MKNLKKLALVACSMVALHSCSTPAIKSYNEGINIIPIPTETTVNEGRFTLKSSTKIITSSDSELSAVANFFADKMSKSTGYQIVTTEGTVSENNAINIVLDSSSSIAPEGYSLSVTPKYATITATTPQGAFYGMQSLMQLLPAEIESLTVVGDMNWSAQAVEIKDEPRFGYRGMMLDVCRHFSTVEEVKRHIDVLSMFKINTLHWHLTEDQLWTVEIKKYPKLATVGAKRLEGEGHYHEGSYTQEQLKEVVKYASDRFVTIIPEIELPGHALAALTAYPEYSCAGGPFQIRNVWGVEADVYCAGKESTFEFLEDVLSEIIPIFPSEYIHIGGDECPKERWDVCPACKARMRKEGLKDSHELQSYFITRIEKFINSKGKKIIGWDEILEGGLAPNATVMSWRGEQGGIDAANSGHDVIMTPNSHMYIDHYQGKSYVEPVSIGGYLPLEKTYSYNPIPKDIAADKSHHVIGVQANCWTEYMPDHASREYMAYPRVLAVAEVGWSPIDKKDFADFDRRLANASVRMDALDVNYHIPIPEGVETDRLVYTDKATLEFNNTRSYPMVYTLDGTVPTAASTLYSEPIILDSDATVTIATLLPSGKTSAPRTIVVAKEELSPASDKATKPGVLTKTADGHFLKSSDYADAKFGKSASSSNFMKFKQNAYKSPSVIVTEGYFEVAADGVYVLATDNAELIVDGKLLIDNNLKTSRHFARPASMALAKGKHQFKLVMNNSVVGGWPNVWSTHGFSIKGVNESEYKRVDKDMLSY